MSTRRFTVRAAIEPARNGVGLESRAAGGYGVGEAAWTQMPAGDTVGRYIDGADSTWGGAAAGPLEVPMATFAGAPRSAGEEWTPPAAPVDAPVGVPVKQYGGFRRLSDLRRQNVSILECSAALATPAVASTSSHASSHRRGPVSSSGSDRDVPGVTAAAVELLPASLYVEKQRTNRKAASTRRVTKAAAQRPQPVKGRGQRKSSAGGLLLRADGTLYPYSWVTKRGQRKFVYNRKELKGARAYQMWSLVKAKQEELDLQRALGNAQQRVVGSSDGGPAAGPVPSRTRKRLRDESSVAREAVSATAAKLVKSPSDRAKRTASLAASRSTPLHDAFIEQQRKRLAVERYLGETTQRRPLPRDVQLAQPPLRPPSPPRGSAQPGGAKGVGSRSAASIPRGARAISTAPDNPPPLQSAGNGCIIISEDDVQSSSGDTPHRSERELPRCRTAASRGGQDVTGLFFCEELEEVPLAILASIWGHAPPSASHSPTSDESLTSVSTVTTTTATSSVASSLSQPCSDSRESDFCSIPEDIQNDVWELADGQAFPTADSTHPMKPNAFRPNDDDEAILFQPSCLQQRAVGTRRAGIQPFGVSARSPIAKAQTPGVTTCGAGKRHCDAPEPFFDRYEHCDVSAGPGADAVDMADLFPPDETVGGFHYGGM